MNENLMGMGLGMLAIAGTWAAALAAFSGIGLAFLRWSGFGRDGSENLFAAIWIGWAFTLGGLQIWHLFWPVDLRARALFLAFGLGAFFWNLPFLLRQARPVSRRALVFSVMSMLLAIWLANQAMAPAMHYDAGLYHLNTIRWIQAYPIVPGLGNLHGRLAYNSSYFLYMAALDFGPWSDRAQHVAVYFLLLLLSLQIGRSGYAVLLRSRPVMSRDLFRLALLPLVVAKMFSGMNDAENDLAFWIIGIVIVDQLVGLLLDRPGGKEAWTSVFLVLVLSAAATAVKLSAAVLGVVSSLIALVWIARHGGGRAAARSPSRSWFKTLTPPALLVAAWTVRGYVLSGYPAYPNTLGGLDVEWRVPAARANTDMRWIMSWARIPVQNPDIVLASWGWLKPWSERVAAMGFFEIVLPLLLSGLCLLAAVARGRRWESSTFTLGALALPPVSSLAYWFAYAPLPRYAGAAPWLLAAISLLLAAERWEVRRSSRFAVGLLIVSLIAGVSPYLGAEKFWNPGPERGFYALPQADIIEVPLPSGLVVLDPVEGDQCWDAPLLCTADVRLDLRLRVAGQLGDGFTIAP